MAEPPGAAILGGPAETESAGTAMTAARSAGRDNLLDRLNPVTRLGLAIQIGRAHV